MTVGVLFRGPIRPNINNVLQNKNNFLSFLKDSGVVYESWLCTWNTHLGNKVIIPSNEFDNVITMVEPDNDFAKNKWGIERVGTGQTTNRIWKAMLSSRIALEAMYNTGKYDWIVHARTDGVYDLTGYLDTWFREGCISTKHVKPFINDMLNIGPADLIKEIYNYGSIENLGTIVKQVFCPEQILMEISNRKGIYWNEAQYNTVWMDEERNIGDPML